MTFTGVRTRLRIRTFEARDLEGVHQLGLHCFPQDRSMAGEIWRFVETPAGVVPGTVALDGDRIVASYTAWPITLYVGGETVQGAQAIDVMTHPDYRGQGLFGQLAEATHEMMADLGYELVYGFPNDQSYPGFIHRLDWVDVGKVPTLKRLLVPLPDPLDPVSLLSPKARQGKLTCGTHWAISDETVPPSDLAILASQKKEAGICLRRDSLWFSWRYSPAGPHIYKTLTARREGCLEAVIIYREESHRVILAETLGSSDALQVVVTELVKRGRRRGIRVMTALTTDPVVAEVLRMAGFWLRGYNRLIVKQLSSRLLKSDIHTLGHWTLYGGDHDVY